jgi:Flp pilus assembly protein TadB
VGKRFQDVGHVFGQCRTADGPDYWDDPGARHDDHRRHVRNLLIACAIFVLAGAVVHPSLLMLLVLLVPFLLVELYMLRRSGSRRLPELPIAAAPYEPGGDVDVVIELEPNDPLR